MMPSTMEDATLNEIRSLEASDTNMDDVANADLKDSKISPKLIKYIAKTKTTA